MKELVRFLHMCYAMHYFVSPAYIFMMAARNLSACSFGRWKELRPMIESKPPPSRSPGLGSAQARVRKISCFPVADSGQRSLSHAGVIRFRMLGYC